MRFAKESLSWGGGRKKSGCQEERKEVFRPWDRKKKGGYPGGKFPKRGGGKGRKHRTSCGGKRNAPVKKKKKE